LNDHSSHSLLFSLLLYALNKKYYCLNPNPGLFDPDEEDPAAELIIATVARTLQYYCFGIPRGPSKEP
jgi:hypothetical protein